MWSLELDSRHGLIAEMGVPSTICGVYVINQSINQSPRNGLRADMDQLIN